ncbi:ferritin family protein [Lentisphaerota bacterium WC36G]|nr:ferritin family protein [Lentisphaerae bacterium WC36]
MGYCVNTYEVFEMAEQVERNGLEFYQHAAEVVKDKSVKDLLLELAKMESDHEEKFFNIKKRLELSEHSIFPDLDDLVVSNLRALATGKVFKNSPEDVLVSDETTVEDILDVALDFERNTIVFFSSLKTMMKDCEEQKIIDLLIKEEVDHIAILMEKKGKLDKNG